jgi:hypothetical protein
VLQKTETVTTDVIICGCGPTDAMLSGYLGRLSVQNIVLEKELDITQDPRGIALNEDGIRYVQGLGKVCLHGTKLLGLHADYFVIEMGYFNFISGGGSLHITLFLKFNYNTVRVTTFSV